MVDTTIGFVILGILLAVFLIFKSDLGERLLSSFRKMPSNVNVAPKKGGVRLLSRFGETLIKGTTRIGDKLIPTKTIEYGNKPVPINLDDSFAPSPDKLKTGDMAGQILIHVDKNTPRDSLLKSNDELTRELTMANVRNIYLEKQNKELSSSVDDVIMKRFTTVGGAITKARPPTQFVRPGQSRGYMPMPMDGMEE